MSKKKKKNESQIERIMRECNKKIRSVKFEKKKAQCDCLHKSDSGKTGLRHVSDKDFILRCKKCKRKVDFGVLRDKNADDTAKYIKDTFNEAINLCDIVKVNISPKIDKKYAKLVSKTQFELFQMKKLAKIIIADSFENKKNKGKKRRKSGFTMAAGGSSLM